jgi:hypothetical protein
MSTIFKEMHFPLKAFRSVYTVPFTHDLNPKFISPNPLKSRYDEYFLGYSLLLSITIASGGVTVYFPKDEKKFSVTKNAAEGVTSVNVKSAMPIKASANSTGYVELDLL